MTQRQKINPPHREDEPAYQLVVRRDERGLEQLTIARLIETAERHGEAVARDRLIDLACRIYDTRRTRSRYFHSSLLGEPVWDMLLALFCLPSRWKKLTIGGLAHAADVPLTTGLRWAKLMEQKGLIGRSPDPLDARRVYVSLTDRGEQVMREYLSSIYHQVVEG
jgi:DNA-binding MarR family transcriptional regulator